MSYFSSVSTVEEIKKLYRKLCSQFHPDRGGDLEIMKTVNVEYKQALSGNHGQKSTDSYGNEHTYYYNEHVEDALMEKIQALLALKMNGVEVALIGVWIWVTGDNTKDYRQEFKNLKLRWHSKRKAWYFQTSKKKSRYKKNFSMDDMANAYGYKSFKSDEKLAIA